MSIVISAGGDSGLKTYNANCVAISYDGSKIICGGTVPKPKIFSYTTVANPEATGTVVVPAIFSYNDGIWSTKCSDIVNITCTDGIYSYTTYDTENQKKTTEIMTSSSDPRIFKTVNPNNLYNTLLAKIGDNAYMSGNGSVQALVNSGAFPYSTETRDILGISYNFPKPLFKSVVKLTNNIIDTIPNVDNNFLCTDFIAYKSKEFIIGDSTGTYLYLVKSATLYGSDNGIDKFKCIATNSNIGFNGINLGFSVDIQNKKAYYKGGILAGSMSNLIDTNLYTIFIVKTIQGDNKEMIFSTKYNHNLYISTSFAQDFKLITKASLTENFPQDIEWIDVVMSKDGKYILALYKLDNKYGIYRSTNGTDGINATFTNLITPLISTPILDYCMTMSDNGKQMMYIIANTSNLYYSNDYGANWSLTHFGLPANSIKLSGDGKVLVIGAASGNFHRKTITWPA